MDFVLRLQKSNSLFGDTHILRLGVPLLLVKIINGKEANKLLA